MEPICPVCKSLDQKKLMKRSEIGGDSNFLYNYANLVQNIELFNRGIYKCNVCGMQFIFPTYSSSDFEALYSVEGHRHFTDVVCPIKEFRSERVREILANWKQDLISLGIVEWKSLFSKQNDRKPRLLDIGCGRGASLYIFDELGFDVTGLDLADHQIEFIREHLNFEVHKAGWEDFQTDQKFDGICAQHIIEHVNDPHRFIDKLVSLLSPGGFILLETPLTDDYGQREHRYRDIYHTLFFDHFTLALLMHMHGMLLRRSQDWAGLSCGNSYQVNVRAIFMGGPSSEQPGVQSLKETDVVAFRRAYDSIDRSYMQNTRNWLESVKHLDRYLPLRFSHLVRKAWHFYDSHGFLATARKTFDYVSQRWHA